MAVLFKSPAKVNLSLKIHGKRQDGYHTLETVMARIDLWDRLYFENADSLSISCDYEGVPVDESNLVMKAVRLLEGYTGKIFNYHIKLEKSIPHGAGLAGGSSNAATTLKAINQLENLKLSTETLAGIAADLGADVAFFLYEATCVCSGIGEIVEPLNIASDKLDAPLLLLKPRFEVSTPKAYKAFGNSSEITDVSYVAQLMAWGEMVNDLEKPVFAKHRYLAELKMWLLSQDQVQGALMSGSGSTVFAVLKKGISLENQISLELKVKNEFDPNLWSEKVSILE